MFDSIIWLFDEVSWSTTDRIEVMEEFLHTSRLIAIKKMSLFLFNPIFTTLKLLEQHPNFYKRTDTGPSE